MRISDWSSDVCSSDLASSPVAMNVRASPLFKGMASYDPILGKSLSASLALSDVTTFISTSHALTIPTSLATHPHRCSQVQCQPRGLHLACADLHCLGGFTRSLYQPRMHR